MDASNEGPERPGPKKGLAIAAVAFLGLTIIALPTALLFGLGDLVAGGGAGRAVGTVVFTAVGIGVCWTVQFLWQYWREEIRGR